MKSFLTLGRQSQQALMLHVCVLRQCVCELWVWVPVCQQVTEVRLIVVEGVCVVVCERIVVHECVSVCVRAAP